MLCLLLAAAAPCQARADYVPRPGQPGKDVPWVPTPDEVVDRMLRTAQLTKRDLVVDLGSGDGRIVIAAAKRGARAEGIEYNADLVQLSRRAAADAGVGDLARFIQGDLFQTDFRRASVVTMYLLPPLIERLRPYLLALKPGTRIVAYAYPIADWEPDEVTELYGFHAVYVWIVPAAVSGVWKVQTAGKQYEIVFEQRFQKISATTELGKAKVGLRDVRLRGAQIWFTLVDMQGVRRDFSGRVNGKRMEGTVKQSDGRTLPFTAHW